MKAIGKAIAIVLLSMACTAHAQKTAPPTAATPRATQAPVAPRAADNEPSDIVQAALRVAQLIDEGKAAQVWDGASPASKKALDQKKFADGIAQTRKALGAPTNRAWVMVSRQIVPASKGTPAGLYASARFETRFASRTAHELISFRLDEDNTWRVSGYVVQ